MKRKIKSKDGDIKKAHILRGVYYYHIYEWEKHRGKSRRKKWLY